MESLAFLSENDLSYYENRQKQGFQDWTLLGSFKGWYFPLLYFIDRKLIFIQKLIRQLIYMQKLIRQFLCTQTT